MADIQKMIEEVKGMTVLELNELVKALEEEFGVSAAAPVAVAAAPAAAAAPAEEEKTEFKVSLKDAGANKIAVIKAVREFTGLGLVEAKKLVEDKGVIKENATKETNKIIDTLTKELEGLSPEGLQEFFKFFYHMNHNYGNMIALDNFEEFLETFDSNPFKVNEDKKFRKQLIDAVIKYSTDYMSLITAAVLIKKKFNMEELTRNYYASVDVFDGNWY
jgi:large subunit ribosomal protein L7/L12